MTGRRGSDEWDKWEEKEPNRREKWTTGDLLI